MSWPVSEEYVVIDGRLTPQGSDVAESPLDKPDALINEFSKLQDGDETGLVTFAKKWGLLGAVDPPLTEGPLDPDNPPIEQESTRWIWNHADNVRLALEIWQHLVHKDEPSLNRTLRQYVELEDLPEGWPPRLGIWVPLREHGEGDFSTFSWAGTVETAYRVLAWLINPNIPARHFILSGRPLALWPTEDPTPLDTIYGRLAEAIANGREARSCKECGEPFLVEDPRQLYCPPTPGTKSGVSRCLARVQKRRQRAKRKKGSSE
jgi:hypothetical protein